MKTSICSTLICTHTSCTLSPLLSTMGQLTFLFLFFGYSCPSFSLFVLPCPTPPPSVSLHPVVHYQGSFIHTPWLDPSPFFPSLSFYPSPLWSLSVCSLFPCLCFCFARLFCSLCKHFYKSPGSKYFRPCGSEGSLSQLLNSSIIVQKQP